MDVTQLTLPLQLDDHALFSSFYSQGNENIVDFLNRSAAGNGQPGCWICGGAATGKTHLLQAVCASAGDRSIYVPLREFVAGGSGILNGLASRELVCLDEMHDVAGESEWNRELFGLCNDLMDAGHTLVVASRATPRESGFVLPDLQSRLSRLALFQLQPLAECDRMPALKLRSRLRGLDLPDDTARYLLTHARRDMASLYTLLDTLDREALRRQRRLTLPFVKSVLESAVD